MTETMNATEAAALIRKGDAVLIDVREADEFKAEHIVYALSIPLSDLEGGFKMLDIPSDKAILFHCLKGARGEMACTRILGLETCQNRIINIEGGIDAWKASGLPVIGGKSGSSKLSVMRQVQMVVGLLIVICVFAGYSGAGFAFVLAGVFGAALFFAGLTGWCGLAMLLNKMPWNK